MTDRTAARAMSKDVGSRGEIRKDVEGVESTGDDGQTERETYRRRTYPRRTASTSSALAPDPLLTWAACPFVVDIGVGECVEGRVRESAAQWLRSSACARISSAVMLAKETMCHDVWYGRQSYRSHRHPSVLLSWAFVRLVSRFVSTFPFLVLLRRLPLPLPRYSASSLSAPPLIRRFERVGNILSSICTCDAPPDLLTAAKDCQKAQMRSKWGRRATMRPTNACSSQSLCSKHRLFRGRFSLSTFFSLQTIANSQFSSPLRSSASLFVSSL
jgi:hypothetical protein